MFIAYVNQTDNGCDYTIACGKKLIELEATTYDEAIAELKCLFFDFPDQSAECEDEKHYFENEIEEITLYEVSNKIVLPISDWYEEIRRQKEERQLRQKADLERELYERLKQKFG